MVEALLTKIKDKRLKKKSEMETIWKAKREGDSQESVEEFGMEWEEIGLDPWGDEY